MASKAIKETELLNKIRTLPEDQVKEVDDFVDFLRQRRAEGGLRKTMTALSDPVFQRIWDNPDDAAYDQL